MLEPDVRDYLEEIASRTGAVLGERLVGVYAAGSIALDSYRKGRSDIDVALVCTDPLPLADKEALVDRLRHESLPCPARGLELVAYRAEVAAAGTQDAGFEFELNSGPSMAFRTSWSPAERPIADGLFWYAIDRSIVAERGRAVVGPPATAVFRSVGLPDLIDLLVASLRWHLGPALEQTPPADAAAVVAPVISGPVVAPVIDADEAPAWTDDAVLNGCRAWQRVRTGHWSSKDGAAMELLDESAGEPYAATVRQAVAARAGGPRPSERDARAFQRTVLAALLARSRGRAG